MASKSAGAARRSEPAPPGGPPTATPSGKDDYLRRLGKIEGQVRGLQKMIEADTWCPDVVTQVASATRAVQEVAVGLLSDHLRHCVIHAVHSSPAEGDQALVEATGAIRQVVRL